MSGMLLLVATPIGNLGDCSARAIEALRSADVLCCEDTRHTRKLLNHFGIDVRVTALHEHNEIDKRDWVVERVRAGETVALVTDAGMPGISDPGALAVAAVAAAGLRVSVVPGASAVVAALAISGMPTDRFCFEGFLPRKASVRAARIAEIAQERRTTVLYEAPHRLHKTVDELRSACGEGRPVALVRELTKIHEEVVRGTLGDLATRFAEEAPKGECVLVLHGAEEPVVEVDDSDIIARLEAAQAAGASRRDAIDHVAAELGLPRKRVYSLALARPRS